MTHSVRDADGRAIGSATVDLTLDSVQKFVSTIKPFGTGNAKLVSQNGVWLAHPDSNRWGETVDSTFLKKALISAKTGKSFHGERQESGSRELVVSVPLDFGTGDIWFLIISAPVEVITVEADALRNKLLLLSIVILSLATLFYWLIARKTTLPLKILTDHLQLHDGKEPSDFPPFLDRSDEIGLLTRTIHANREKRHKAEEALRLREEHFRMLVETTSDWIWEIDTAANFTYASPGIKQILGYEPEELVGKKSGYDLMPPEEAERMRDEFGRIVSAAEPFNAIIRINLHKNGRRVFIESCGRPFFDGNGRLKGYRGIDRDISERVHSAKKLKESEQYFKGIVEDLPVMVCRFFPDGVIIFANAPYCHYFQKKPEEMIGSSFLSLIPEENRETVLNNILSLTVDSPTRTHEHPVIDPNGDIKWQRWTNRALFNEKNELVAFQSVGEDITRQKRMLEKLTESESRFRNLYENAPLAYQSLDEGGKIIAVNNA